MVEVLRDVVLHRTEEREPVGVPEDVHVDVVPEAAPIRVDEMRHPDLVGLFGLLEVRFERRAGAGLVRFKERFRPFDVAGDVDPVPVFEENPVVWIEVL